ncbi:TadE/TadG family type IV pilus assembly protein [Gimesia benthica]|uniref:TadE/TadG family type IV pilus assembly protein n=1 Tax=Gimesia benthica TaxID=2608982 RepID=UPI001884D099|nr:TadE family protein [Gimesia benthica]
MVLELILTAPAFLIIMLAIVEFSLVYTAIEQTAYASRTAAKIASETNSGSLDTLVSSGDLKSRVDRYLQVGGLPLGSCRVILQYNVLTGGVVEDDRDPDPAVAGCDCGPPSSTLPSVTGASATDSVRTTVCVKLDGNIPDFLSGLGFSIQDYVVEESTTYIYEL